MSKRIKQYLQCPKCGKTIKMHWYKSIQQYANQNNTICCYPTTMRLVSNERGRLPKFG